MNLYKKRYCMMSILIFLFLFCSVTGHDLAKEGNIIWSFGYFIKLMLFCLVPSFLICPIGAAILHFMKTITVFKKNAIFSCSAKTVFFLGWIVLMLAWLPCFLAYFPGICAYDTTIQLGYIARNAVSEHHPVIHTLLLKAFTSFGGGTIGIACYTLFQMLVLSAAFAGALGILQHFRCKRIWIIFLGIYGMFFPFHMYLSVSVTKDTFFAAFMLLQLMCLYGLITDNRASSGLSLWDIGFLCFSVLMILFRNNGIYAFAVLTVCLFLILIFGSNSRRNYKKLFLLCLAALVTGYALLRIISALAGAVQGDRREMLSVPMQQLARTVYYHEENISAIDMEMIHSLISAEGLADYRPDIADPVKRAFNTSAILKNPKQFISTYLGLFIKYPGDYINAFLSLNAGYLYPWDESHAYINMEHGERGLGYVQTRWLTDELGSYDVYASSKLPGLQTVFEEFASTNAYLNIPVLRYLFMPGIWFWACLAAAAILLYKKQYRLLIPFSLLGGYYLSLLLGPTVQLRYVYPVMISLPFILVFIFSVKDMPRIPKSHKNCQA